MHSPESVAFEIYLGKKKNKKGQYRSPFITIWHIDPEKDGTDDSCGWMIRTRHCDQGMLLKIQKEFDFNFKHKYWFSEAGDPNFSTSGIVLQMYRTAAWAYFKQNSRKFDKFFQNHLHEILHFAENPVDCIGDRVTNKWGYSTHEERFGDIAAIIYSDICRKMRPWYKHPKWHIHHWQIQFHPWTSFKTKYLRKCTVCNKRGLGKLSHWISDWGGNNVRHDLCDNQYHKNIEDGNN